MPSACRAVGDADGPGSAQEGGRLVLEGFHVGAEDRAAAAQHLQHGTLDALLQLGVLSFDIHQADGHSVSN
jgi:hypothetical protein